MFPGHPIAAAQLARLHMNEDLARSAAQRHRDRARNAAARVSRPAAASRRLRLPALRRAWAVRLGL